MLIYMLSILMVLMIIIVWLSDDNQVTQSVFIFAMLITLAIFWGIVLT